jgi:5-formyltetrahydrofolate cyclo-ligase
MISRRQVLPAKEQAERSARICERTFALAAAHRVVALYASIRGEVDLRALDTSLREKNVRVCYPRVEGPGLTFHETAYGELVPAGRFNIPEPPATAALVMPEQLEALVIPGLAFDENGHRLGWGAGFYDALLRRAPRARRIGVCYEFQLVDEVPHGSNDEPVHVVVTDVATTFVQKERTP